MGLKLIDTGGVEEWGTEKFPMIFELFPAVRLQRSVTLTIARNPVERFSSLSLSLPFSDLERAGFRNEFD